MAGTPMRAFEVVVKVVRKAGVLRSRCKVNVRNGPQNKEEANTEICVDVGLDWIKEESVGD